MPLQNYLICSIFYFEAVFLHRAHALAHKWCLHCAAFIIIINMRSFMLIFSMLFFLYLLASLALYLSLSFSPAFTSIVYRLLSIFLLLLFSSDSVFLSLLYSPSPLSLSLLYCSFYLCIFHSPNRCKIRCG